MRKNTAKRSTDMQTQNKLVATHYQHEVAQRYSIDGRSRWRKIRLHGRIFCFLFQKSNYHCNYQKVELRLSFSSLKLRLHYNYAVQVTSLKKLLYSLKI